MKVRVDENRCQGHGRCYSREPEMFEPIDDDGHAAFRLNEELAENPDLLAKVVEAIANCPEHAITIDESGSAQR